MTELKQLQQRLERQAYYDDLTGIYNRRAFFLKTDQAFEASKDKQLPFTIILFDIDHFKKVNDTYGHHIGDQMLIHVASICSDQQRAEMLFARYGGEEFVLALPGYTHAQGEAFAHQLREKIALTPLRIEQTVIHVTSSFGVATVKSSTEQSWAPILQHADVALYSAKHAGRNQVKVHSIG
jgi:diguanylate cyclase (GGDEF)-like protein